MIRRDIFTLGGAAALAARGAARSANSTQSGPEHVFFPRSFGAIGDGKTKDTAAIQRAIDACTQSGGGTVYVAPGLISPARSS